MNQADSIMFQCRLFRYSGSTMKRFVLIPLFAALLAFSQAGFAQQQVAANSSANSVDTSAPDAMIKTLTNQVLDILRTDNSVRGGDNNRVMQVVNERILPYTDFERTTRLAMRRAWRQATPEQRKEMVEEFKKLLVYSYAGALKQFRDQQVQFLPFRANPTDTDVVVYSRVINNGQPVELDYRLTKTPSGWRVYDLNIAGAWLIQAYQQQFDQKISESGLDGLIQFLVTRNKELASGKQPS